MSIYLIEKSSSFFTIQLESSGLNFECLFEKIRPISILYFQIFLDLLILITHHTLTFETKIQSNEDYLIY